MSSPSLELLREKAFNIGPEAAVITGAYDQYDLHGDRFLVDTSDLGPAHAVTLLFTDPDAADGPLLHRVKFLHPERYDKYKTGLGHVMLFENPMVENQNNVQKSPGMMRMMANALVESVGRYSDDCLQRIGSIVLLGALTLHVKDEDEYEPTIMVTVPKGFVDSIACVMGGTSDFDDALESFDQLITDGYNGGEDAGIDQIIDGLHVVSSEYSESHEPSVDAFRAKIFAPAMQSIKEKGIEHMVRARAIDRMAPLFLAKEVQNVIFRKVLFEDTDSE